MISKEEVKEMVKIADGKQTKDTNLDTGMSSGMDFRDAAMSGNLRGGLNTDPLFLEAEAQPNYRESNGFGYAPSDAPSVPINRISKTMNAFWNRGGDYDDRDPNANHPLVVATDAADPARDGIQAELN